jgi:hypothetical protein
VGLEVHVEHHSHPQRGHAQQPWRSTGADTARRTHAAATVSRTMACLPPSRATLTNPPARLAARPISSQGRAGAPVRASPCQDHDDQSPPGYDLDPPSGRSRSDHPRTGQKRYINVGRTARRSALGPGSPTGSRRCSQKAFSVGSNPTRGTSRDYNPKPRYNVSSC